MALNLGRHNFLHIKPNRIGGRTEWIKLVRSVPGLYLCASLPATYPGGLSLKGVDMYFWGVIFQGQCIKNIQNYITILEFYPLDSGSRRERKDRKERLERRMKETRLNSNQNQENKREKGEGRRNMIADDGDSSWILLILAETCVSVFSSCISLVTWGYLCPWGLPGVTLVFLDVTPPQSIQSVGKNLRLRSFRFTSFVDQHLLLRSGFVDPVRLAC